MMHERHTPLSPPEAPAPTMVWISSIKRMMFPALSVTCEELGKYRWQGGGVWASPGRPRRGVRTVSSSHSFQFSWVSREDPSTDLVTCFVAADGIKFDLRKRKKWRTKMNVSKFERFYTSIEIASNRIQGEEHVTSTC